MTDELRATLRLPSGAVMSNRLVKAPLEEMLSTFGGGKPNDRVFRLYRTWADGGWGMIITGNVSVDRRFIGAMFDVVCPQREDPAFTEAFTKYARATKGFDVDDERGDHAPADGSRPLAVVQLVHCGRQSMRGAGRWPWTPTQAPSPIPLCTGGKPSLMDSIMFGTPKEMTTDDIHHLIARFVQAAVLMEKAGFDGIELHAAHGYLLSSFLNPVANVRTDAYGGSAENRFRIIREIIEAIRARVRPSFVIGIKLNSSDFVQGGQTEDDALQNVRWLAELKTVDFVEVSGGTYEAPAMLQSVEKSERTKRREGFFTAFAQRAHSALPADSKMAIFVTGGFYSREGMRNALTSGDADAICLGRTACLEPKFPAKVLDPQISDEQAVGVQWQPPPPPSFMKASSVLGFGWSTMWHSAQLHLVSRGKPTSPDASMSEFARYLRYW